MPGVATSVPAPAPAVDPHECHRNDIRSMHRWTALPQPIISILSTAKLTAPAPAPALAQPSQFQRTPWPKAIYGTCNTGLHSRHDTMAHEAVFGRESKANQTFVCLFRQHSKRCTSDAQAQNSAKDSAIRSTLLYSAINGFF